jgi:aspartokinase-like uncharacterized kinase
MSRPLRVVKVGGSLFSLPDLPTRLECWLDRQPEGTTLLLAGGGALVDVVRNWDAQFRLGEERSHWLCIDLLDATAKLLGHLLPHAALCGDLGTVRQSVVSHQGGLFVFAPARFFCEQEPLLPGTPLERSWEVTSDSIAARCAELLKADELVLLKSALPPEHDEGELSGGHYVDRCFTAAARSLPHVRMVNLRDDAFSEQVLAR